MWCWWIDGILRPVDGDKLVEMFEALGLGLRPKKDYGIDQPFFDQYQ
jgi:hypothetical protein